MLFSVDCVAVMEDAVGFLQDRSCNIDTIQRLCLGVTEGMQTPEYLMIRELVTTLGSFPGGAGLAEKIRPERCNVFVTTIMQAMYRSTRWDTSVDQIAIANACLNYHWSIDQFMERWVRGICNGIPSGFVRKDRRSRRERNHFLLIRDEFGKLETQYSESPNRM